MSEETLIEYLKERMDRLEDKSDKMLTAQADLKSEFGRLKGLPARIEKVETRTTGLEKIEWRREGARGLIVALIMGAFEFFKK